MPTEFHSHTLLSPQMRIPPQIFSPSTVSFNRCFRRVAFSKPLPWRGTPSRLYATRNWSGGGSFWVDSRRKLWHGGKNGKGTRVSAVEKGNLGADVPRKREVIDHICLIKANEDLSEDQEKDMLDYLYTIQYYMRGIVSISLGRICDQNPERYTHAVFMRFQTKKDLANFYNNSFYTGVLKEHVIPHCHGLINLDYESEVEDDILPIFRKGEEFNYGVEFVFLAAFIRDSLGGAAEDAMISLAHLAMEFPSLIVQITNGPNVDANNKEYTHGAVIRFRSYEALKMFMSSSEYRTLWKSKFQPIIQKSLSVYFSIDPIGTELMSIRHSLPFLQAFNTETEGHHPGLASSILFGLINCYFQWNNFGSSIHLEELDSIALPYL